MMESSQPAHVGPNAWLGAVDEAFETCKYWKSRGDVSGNCRRFPPVADGLQIQQAAINGHESGEDYASHLLFYWWQPCCEGHDWCGEWKATNVGIEP